MKKLFLLLLTLTFLAGFSQTTLTEAVDFHVKTVFGETIKLFPLLDDNQQIVVIDFFSTSCGPCQEYAPDFQACYEKFGFNQGNVYFMGLNWGGDNNEVIEFDSVFGLTFPSVSGNQGGANLVYEAYNIQSYPSIVVITPDHQIFEQQVWVPDEANITQAVLNAGGLFVGVEHQAEKLDNIRIYPQPARDFIRVSLNVATGSNLTFNLYQLTGKMISTQHYRCNEAGENQFNFQLPDVKNGIYILKITDDNGSVTRKVSIVNNR